MPNNFVTNPSILAREALMILQNQMVIAGLVYRDLEAYWGGAKAGETVNVRKPATFVTNEYNGSTVVVQDINEGSVGLTLEKHFDITVGVSSKEWTLSLDQFSERVVAPVLMSIADSIDSYVLGKFVEFHQSVGTAGTPAASIANLAAVDRKANETKMPLRNRIGIVNPATKASLMAIEAFHRADARGDDGTALREASMGRVMGVDWFMAQNVKTHTAGTATAITVTSTATLGASTINLTSSGTLTLKKGDLLTIAGDEYVVTADNTATAGAHTAVGVYPPLKAAYAGTTPVTKIATHAANLVFHPNSMALAVVPLELPQGAAKAGYFSEGGMGVRVVYGYDMQAKKDTISFDLLCGARVIQPELGFRLLG